MYFFELVTDKKPSKLKPLSFELKEDICWLLGME